MSFHSAPAVFDQADGLRRLFAERDIPVLPVLAPTGNQGALVAHLALAHAHVGREVLIVDASRGEVALAMGQRARYELAHVVSGDKSLEDVVLHAADGVRIVPAARALMGATNVDRWLAALAGELQPQPDLILLHHCTSFAGMDGDLLVIATPMADSLTRTYSELKRLGTRRGRIRLFVAGAASESSARNLHRALSDAARRFIGAAIDWAGFVSTEAEAQTSAYDSFVALHDRWELPRVSPSRTGR
jgi:flagellar biosynthesis protein FlhG